MADIKWIKISVNMFDDEKIKIIEAMPEGDTIIVIWQKLICLAGKINSNGFILLTEKIPYSDELLSITFKRSLQVVRLALKTFGDLEMIEYTENKTLLLTNFCKHQNIEGLEKIRKGNAERQKRFKEKNKLLLLQDKKPKVTQTKRKSNATDIDIDKDLDKDIKDIPVSKNETVLVNELVSQSHTEAVKIFCDYYELKTGIKYNFIGKDAKHIQQLLKRLYKILTKEKTKENLLSALSYFIENIKADWIINNLSIATINSKFNEILNQIKNGIKKTNGKGFSSDSPEKWQRIFNAINSGAIGDRGSTP
jgi:predicted phage replisome organizer